MKKLLFLFAFISAAVSAQTLSPQGGISIHAPQKGGGGAEKVLVVPIGNHDALYPLVRTQGRVQVNAADSTFEYHNGTAWQRVLSESEGLSLFKLSTDAESDPTVPAYVKNITSTEKTNWGSAFGWGNHAAAGYLTSYSETDPMFNTKFSGKSTSDLAEGTRLYYTDARARASITVTTSGTGAATYSGGVLNIPKPVTQYGTGFTKEFNGKITTGAESTAVFNISSAGFVSITSVQVAAKYSGATAVNAPVAVITAESLTSITVTILESKTTNTLILSSAEGLELHAVAGTEIYLTVKGN